MVSCSADLRPFPPSKRSLLFFELTCVFEQICILQLIQNLPGPVLTALIFVFVVDSFGFCKVFELLEIIGINIPNLMYFNKGPRRLWILGFFADIIIVFSAALEMAQEPCIFSHIVLNIESPVLENRPASLVSYNVDTAVFIHNGFFLFFRCPISGIIIVIHFSPSCFVGIDISIIPS
ncbi:hypothetical protein BJ875DRAFT_250216 [Amylocarpus encephaloides]|uniref:Uncharacterized protein n=1 Tax=Amylocarpus encephaloides TaxID=45428 RepID=A0A9P7Y7J6_9HELO|nr:hypothetical protein BJ875DRAFT_250216 [Amylocarpus encephaloides]